MDEGVIRKGPIPVKVYSYYRGFVDGVVLNS
jgi:hypothetical protein